MKARQFAADVYSALKATTRRFIKASFGTQELAAAETRVEQGAMSDYCNEHVESFMPVDVMLDLICASGNTVMLKFLADKADCLLVPLPVGHGGEVAERTGRSAKEFGDVMVRIGAALTDGRIDEAEAAAILLEIREVMVELCALAEAVKASQRGPKNG